MADVVIDEALNLAYISARDRDSVLLLSLANLTLVDEIPVGDGPMGMDVDRTTDRLYVALEGGNGGIAVVNLTSRSLATTWPLPLPFGAVDVVVGRPGRIYVSGVGISAHDTTDGSMVWWTNMLQSVLAISPDFQYLYSGAKYSLPAGVIKWDVESDSPQRVATNRDTNSLSDMALSPNGTRLYLAAAYTRNGNGVMAVLDTGTMTVVDTLPEPDTTAVTVSPDGTRILAGRLAYVYAFSSTNDTLLDTFAGPLGYPRAIRMDPQGRYVLVSQTDYTQSNLNRLLVYAGVYVGPPVTRLVTGAPNVSADTNYITSESPLAFAAIDRSATGIRNTAYRVDGGLWTNYTATGPFSLAVEGEHLLEWYSVDWSGNVEATKNSILRVDDTPPSSTLSVGDPKYLIGGTFVTSSTPLSFTATDGGVTPVGTGIMEVRIDGGSWTTHSAPSTLAGEGPHIVEYRSLDLLRNVEATQSLTVVVDDTPPTTTVAVGTPKYQGVELYLTSATQISLAAVDGGVNPVGLVLTEVRVDGGSWSSYTSSFALAGADGPRTIEYRSRDLLGTVELVRALQVTFDNTPPMTISPSDPPFNLRTRFALAATDSGSGVNYTEFRIDNGTWTTYMTPFAVPEGTRTISYRSVDNVGNVEGEGTIVVLVEVDSKPFVALALAAILLAAGAWSSQRAPWKGGEGRRAALKALAILALPFVLLEGATGVVSLFTGLLPIPPVLGVGTAVDSAILAAGLAVTVYRGVKARRPKSEGSDR